MSGGRSISTFRLFGLLQGIWRTAVRRSLGGSQGFSSLFSSIFLLFAAFAWNRRQVSSPQRVAASPSIPRKKKDGLPFLPPHAVSQTQGPRATMEDAYSCETDIDMGIPYFNHVSMFSVFDGHAGKQAAIFAQENLHSNIQREIYRMGTRNPEFDLRTAVRNGFLQTDRDFLDKADKLGWPDGSTCVTSMVLPHGLLVANIGDSRAILCYEPFPYAEKQDALTPTEKCKVMQLSIDDKPDRPDEKKRIEDSGGFVHFFGCWRVQGILATSRSFGDRELKRYVIADPGIIEVVFGEPSDKTEHTKDASGAGAILHENKSTPVSFSTNSSEEITVDTQGTSLVGNGETLRYLPGNPLFMVMASDGLWDVMSNQEVAHFIFDRINLENMGSNDLVARALQKGSCDNITAVVVDLRRHKATGTL